MQRGGGGAIGRLAGGLLAALVLVLGVAQLALPGIAADRIRSRIARYGRVLDVSVSAWPALELLWGHADSVHVSAGPLRLSPRQAAALLWEARGCDSLDLRAASVALGGVSMRRVTLRKHGSGLEAGALVDFRSVREALPPGVSVRLLGSSPAGVLVRVGGGLFGTAGSLSALASANAGSLVVSPLDAALAGLRLTLFSDRHVRIDGVGAQTLGGSASEPLRYALTLDGHLR